MKQRKEKKMEKIKHTPGPWAYKRKTPAPVDCLCGYEAYKKQGSSGYTICCATGELCIVNAPSVTGWGRPDTVRLWNRRIKRLARDPATIRALAREISKLRMRVFELEQQRKAGKNGRD